MEDERGLHHAPASGWSARQEGITTGSGNVNGSDRQRITAFLDRRGIEGVTLTPLARDILLRHVPERLGVQKMAEPASPRLASPDEDVDPLARLLDLMADTPQSRFVHLQRMLSGRVGTWLSFPIKPITRKEMDDWQANPFGSQAGGFILLGTEEWARLLWSHKGLNMLAHAILFPNERELPRRTPLPISTVVQALLHPYERQGLIGAIAKLSGYSDADAREMALDV